MGRFLGCFGGSRQLSPLGGVPGRRALLTPPLPESKSPRMLDIYNHILKSHSLIPDWSVAVLNHRPKGLGTASVQNLRPLVLQNTSHKWLASILSVQPRDFIEAHTPIQQRGFIRGRSLFTNLWHTFGLWNALFRPIDFKKAYDSVSHDYISVFLRLMHIPQTWLRCVYSFSRHRFVCW